jgi:phage regulator Rha-like protein
VSTSPINSSFSFGGFFGGKHKNLKRFYQETKIEDKKTQFVRLQPASVSSENKTTTNKQKIFLKKYKTKILLINHYSSHYC